MRPKASSLHVIKSNLIKTTHATCCAPLASELMAEYLLVPSCN